MNATAELVQQLIRNQCVNDGTPGSGYESRNADVLEALFDRHKVEVERIEALPGRANLVVRMAGRNPNAPRLILQGHTDVVPADPADWSFDPFGGEIKDGYVHGRGAVDMYNITASMAVAVTELSREGFVPEGDVIFAAVADEENGGAFGAEYLLDRHYDLVSGQYVLGESGGTHMQANGHTYLPVVTGEKGVHWITIAIDGTPGHGSKPYGADNAAIKAADIVHKIARYNPPARFFDGWSAFVAALGFDDDLLRRLSDEYEQANALEEVNVPLAAVLHACSHNTLSPNVIHGGVKVNTIADHAEVKVDIRSLPGMTLSDVEAMVADALGEYSDQVTITYHQHKECATSPTNTPLWHSLQAVSADIFPGAQLVPTLATFGTDARFWRNDGAVAYGAALFDPDDTNFEGHLSMFHGRDEKVGVRSLAHTTALYEGVIRSLPDFF